MYTFDYYESELCQEGYLGLSEYSDVYLEASGEGIFSKVKKLVMEVINKIKEFFTKAKRSRAKDAKMNRKDANEMNKRHKKINKAVKDFKAAKNPAKKKAIIAAIVAIGAAATTTGVMFAKGESDEIERKSRATEKLQKNASEMIDRYDSNVHILNIMENLDRMANGVKNDIEISIHRGDIKVNKNISYKNSLSSKKLYDDTKAKVAEIKADPKNEEKTLANKFYLHVMKLIKKDVYTLEQYCDDYVKATRKIGEKTEKVRRAAFYKANEADKKLKANIGKNETPLRVDHMFDYRK